MIKLHYFDQDEADPLDLLLGLAKMQEYVPSGCLLGGATVMNEVSHAVDPCAGCNGPREKCGGRPRKGDLAFGLMLG